MLQREFGKTGLRVSIVGLGAGHIGSASFSERDCETLLNTALDEGITLIDTAPGYGLSEERIGRLLSHRRRELVLSTKCGYGVPGVSDWTGECIRRGVEQALTRLRTDVIDVLYLHSCPRDVLERDDIQSALDDAVRAGKVRAAGYSGDGEPLRAAVAMPAMRALQASVNLCDQRAINDIASAAGMKGMIAKRPLANAPWRFIERPRGHYCEVYWDRLAVMELDPAPFSWSELAVRFAAFAPGVSACIVGTRNLDHLREVLAHVRAGPLPEAASALIQRRFAEHGREWEGQV
jgi:aryl-alcohol dehydrogenase-like predicted oxidoreductase